MDFTAVATTGVTMQCPVRLGLKKNGSDLWTIPLEPIVSVKASKTIVRRNIAKAYGSGTVKEVWSLDDYEITISGLLQSTENGEFPESALSKLQTFLKPMQSIVIHCKLLDLIGVNLMCVSSWDLPHTAGIENQLYTFSGYSDQYFELV
ncbi:DUF6046 domain-containing protein [Spirosoma areae]